MAAYEKRVTWDEFIDDVEKQIAADTKHLRTKTAFHTMKDVQSKARILTRVLNLVDTSAYLFGWRTKKTKTGAATGNVSWKAKQLEFGRPMGMPVNYRRLREWVLRKFAPQHGIPDKKVPYVTRLIKAKIERDGKPGNYVLKLASENMGDKFMSLAMEYLNDGDR